MPMLEGYGFDRHVQGDFILGADRTWEGRRVATSHHEGHLVMASSNNPSRPLDISWLKAASEVYQISPNIQDYVFAEVPGCQAEIPNRNWDAFPLEELLAYRPILGRVAYKSFQGKLCISGASLVDTDAGLISLRDIPKSGATKVMTPHGMKRILNWMDNGRRDTSTVILENGIRLRGTPDHRVRVLSKSMKLVWKEIQQLEEGDHVAVMAGTPTGPKRQVNLPLVETKKAWVARYTGQAKGGAMNAVHPGRVPTVLTPELARLLGYLVSEGYVNTKYIISFSNKDKDLLEDYQHCWESCFDVPLAAGDKGDGNVEIGCSSAILHDWLSKIGLGYYNAHQKTVPWCILQAPPSLIKHFLKAYWDGDGGAEGAGFSVSPKLRRGLQQLLRRLGIDCGRSRKKGSHFYMLKSEFRKFMALVGTTRKARQWVVDKAGEDWNRTARYGYVPYAGYVLAKLAEESREGHGRSTRYQSKTDERYLMDFHVGHAGDGYLSREKILRHMAAVYLLDEDLAESLEVVLDPRLRFIPVSSVVKSKPCQVYDLEIEDAHQFCANGVVVHNCSLNHDNQVVERAKGVCFDSFMVKHKGKWHVHVITGWCRQKDPKVAEEVLANQGVGFSMACLIGGARCSWCGSLNKGRISCEHIRHGRGKGTILEGKLVYDKLTALNFWELAKVDDRADWDATATWSK